MSSWCYLVRDLLAVAPLGLSGPPCSPWVLPGCPQEGQYTPIFVSNSLKISILVVPSYFCILLVLSVKDLHDVAPLGIPGTPWAPWIPPGGSIHIHFCAKFKKN